MCKLHAERPEVKSTQDPRKQCQSLLYSATQTIIENEELTIFAAVSYVLLCSGCCQFNVWFQIQSLFALVVTKQWLCGSDCHCNHTGSISWYHFVVQACATWPLHFAKQCYASFTPNSMLQEKRSISYLFSTGPSVVLNNSHGPTFTQDLSGT